ncbi:MAG: hypothetical protein RIT45_3271 [Pseudomonadota bacterium]
MALRDFDRVRERIVLRLEVRHLAGGTLLLVGAVSGAFWGGVRYGTGLQRAEQQVACAPQESGPQRGIEVAALPAPGVMSSRRPPVLPRRLAADVAHADAPLAPTLQDLARMGMVAAAQEAAPVRAAAADESAEHAETSETSENAATPATDAPVGSIAAAASTVIPPARELPEDALRSEAAAPSASVSSQTPADEQPCRVDVAYSLPVTDDGRALQSRSDSVGQSVELDLRARTVAALNPDGIAALAAPPTPAPVQGSEQVQAADAPAATEVAAAPEPPAAAEETAATQAPATAEPAVAVAPPAASTPTSARDGRTFFVQVKSLRSESEAEAFAAGLRAKGWRVKIQRADLNDQGTFFRIRLGPYTGMARAQAVRARLRQSTGFDALVMSTAND